MNTINKLKTLLTIKNTTVLKKKVFRKKANNQVCKNPVLQII